MRITCSWYQGSEMLHWILNSNGKGIVKETDHIIITAYWKNPPELRGFQECWVIYNRISKVLSSLQLMKTLCFLCKSFTSSPEESYAVIAMFHFQKLKDLPCVDEYNKSLRRDKECWLSIMLPDMLGIRIQKRQLRVDEAKGMPKKLMTWPSQRILLCCSWIGKVICTWR